MHGIDREAAGGAGIQGGLVTEAGNAGRRFCLLTKILIGCFLSIIPVVILGIVSESEVLLAVGYVILNIIPPLAVGSLIYISLKSDPFRGVWVTVLLLAMSCFLIYNVTYYQVPRARAWPGLRIVCGTNFKGLWCALAVYADEHGGLLPAGDWCDRLIEEADISPRYLRCHKADSVEGESDYCLNPYAAGKQLEELPGDMVLLFESVFTPSQGQERRPIREREGFSDFEIVSEMFTGEEAVYLDRWNRVGGPELLAYDRHETGCNVLLAGGQSKFVKVSDLPALRWDVEGEIVFALPALAAEQKGKIVFSDPMAVPAILMSACVLVSLIVLIRYAAFKSLPVALLVGLLSAATGAGFGDFSEEAYLSEGPTGLIAGGIFGLLAGVCFAVLMTAALEKLRRLKSVSGFSTAAGMATGIVCSTLVHLALMAVNRETNGFGILIGVPFGIMAGALLGAVSGAVLRYFYLRKSPAGAGC